MSAQYQVKIAPSAPRQVESKARPKIELICVSYHGKPNSAPWLRYSAFYSLSPEFLCYLAFARLYLTTVRSPILCVYLYLSLILYLSIFLSRYASLCFCLSTFLSVCLFPSLSLILSIFLDLL